MLKSVLLVLIACSIWGLNYVVPQYMTNFSALEVTLGGFFFLGILSCFFALKQGIKKWKSLSRRTWRQALIYALFVNLLYYLALVTGLRYANASVIALLMGLSPITLAFYGNWRQKECSYRHLVMTSLFIGCGLICVNWEAFRTLSGQASWEYALGLFCGIFALASWNWYIVANARFLKNNPHISSSDWSTMIGIGTFVWVLIAIPFFVAASSAEDLVKYTELSPPLYSFLAGGVILGFICSWLAFYLWNLGSQALPISLAGQLTIFETVFAILFFYLLEASLPTMLELFGMMTTLTGVLLSVHLFRKPQETTSQLLPAPV